MLYKIENIIIEDNKIVDIPEGNIPLKYDVQVSQKDPFPIFTRVLVVLKPYIEGEIKGEEGEEKCFFCNNNMTKQKIGIRPICKQCLTELHNAAEEIHSD